MRTASLRRPVVPLASRHDYRSCPRRRGIGVAGGGDREAPEPRQGSVLTGIILK